MSDEEIYYSSGDESFESATSIIFSSGRSSSPAWSRSSSMTSGTSAKSSTSSEGRKSKAKLGPISRPTPMTLTGMTNRDMQQQRSQDSNPIPAPLSVNSPKKNVMPIQPNIVKPVENMTQPQGWIPYSGPVYSPPLPLFTPPLIFYASPVIPMPMAYTVPIPYQVPMSLPVAPVIFNQPQLRYVSVQKQCNRKWIYVDCT